MTGLPVLVVWLAGVGFGGIVTWLRLQTRLHDAEATVDVLRTALADEDRWARLTAQTIASWPVQQVDRPYDWDRP